MSLCHEWKSSNSLNTHSRTSEGHKKLKSNFNFKKTRHIFPFDSNELRPLLNLYISLLTSIFFLMQKDQIKLLFLLFRQKAQLLFNTNRNVLRGIFYELDIKLGTLGHWTIAESLIEWKWPPRYNGNIVESGVKHHKPKFLTLIGWIQWWFWMFPPPIVQ